MPTADRIKAAAAEEGFAADVSGRSVTDVEISFGILSDPDQQPRSFFYFREPLTYRDMPRDIATVYTDAVDDHTKEKASWRAWFGSRQAHRGAPGNSQDSRP